MAPSDVVGRLRALYGGPSPAERVRRRVGEGGRTERELLAVMTGPSERRALRQMLGSGELRTFPVERVNARGRAYVRSGVFSGSRPSGLDRMAPVVDRGGDLAEARRVLGLSAAEMAGRLYVALSTYQGWEATQPPRGRLRQIAAVLGEAPSGEQLRRLRHGAGWSLKHLGERVGVRLVTVQAWEKGRRPVPSARLSVVLAACAEMAQLEGAPLRERTERIVDCVEREPGISVAAIRHRFRRRQDGQNRMDPKTNRAIKLAQTSGLVVIEKVVQLDSNGRPKAIQCAYPKAARRGRRAPKSPKLTGDQLGAERVRLGLTQDELGAPLGLSSAWVAVQERKKEASISPHWTPRVLEVLEDLAKGPTRDERTGQQVLSVAKEHPGISLWRLRQSLGHGKGVIRAVDSLVAAQVISWGTGWDSCGRAHRALYVAGEAPDLGALEPFRSGELRQLRRDRGLTAAELGERIGVRGNTVTRWETCARRIPPHRIEQLRSSLGSGPEC